MILRPALLPALPLLAVLGLASPAWGAGGQDAAAADALFNEAKALAAAGDFEHACPKFIESHRLGPSAGTLLNIGNCYEKLGKLASAYGAFREAEVLARNRDDGTRQAEAVRRAEILAPQLAKLAITVPPAARVPGFELKKDGSVVGEGQWGSSLPADVGYHEIVATAPGYKQWSSTIRIDTNGSSASVQVQPLEKLPEGTAGGATGFRWGTQRTIGVVLGVAGLAGFGVAAGFTVSAASKNAASLPNCLLTDQTKCNQTGVDLRNQAFDASNIATGIAVGGGLLFAAGVIVFLTTPSGTAKKPDTSTGLVQVQPIAWPGRGGLILQGAW
jgi:serine/threonine-protein kinase